MSQFRDDVLAGLSATPKTLPSKYLYDEEGSRLFEEITRLPEYYPTRVETALLTEIAPQIAAAIPDGAAMVEFGSGSSTKTRLLLDAAPQLAVYAPIDISPDALGPAAEELRARYPKLQVEPITGDFTARVPLPASVTDRPKVGFFPGSTLGNFNAAGAVGFMRSARGMLGSDSLFVVGFDVVKDEPTLLSAYDDAAGVTAAFDLNLLTRINRELGGGFERTAFSHRAVWNADESRMEMHLVSAAPQRVKVDGTEVGFSAGESIHTENSYKFTPDSFREIAEAGGWRVAEQWLSPPPQFAVALLRAA